MKPNQNSTVMKLDQLLSSFFKAEIPDPFPTPNLTAGGVRVEVPMPASREAFGQFHDPRRHQVSKSRLSLALSVALLLGGCWYLSGQIGKAPDRTTIGKGDDSARISKEQQKAMEDPKKASNMP